MLLESSGSIKAVQTDGLSRRTRTLNPADPAPWKTANMDFESKPGKKGLGGLGTKAPILEDRKPAPQAHSTWAVRHKLGLWYGGSGFRNKQNMKAEGAANC